jgi:hypothetical protein
MRSSIFWDVTQRRLVTRYQHFEETCRSDLQRFLLNIGPIGCPETSVTVNQRYIRFQKSDDLRVSVIPNHLNYFANFIIYNLKTWPRVAFGPAGFGLETYVECEIFP